MADPMRDPLSSVAAIADAIAAQGASGTGATPTTTPIPRAPGAVREVGQVPFNPLMGPVTSPYSGVDVVQMTKDATNSYLARSAGISVPTGGAGQGLANQAADIGLRGQRAVQLADTTAAMELSRANAKAAADFGVTPGAPSDLVAQTIESVKALQMQHAAQMNEINTVTNADFVKDPFSWVVNQVRLPFLIENANITGARLQQGFEYLGKVQNAVKDQAATNAAIITGASDARLQGLNDLALAQALEKKAAAANTATQQAIEGSRILLSKNRDELTAQLQVVAAVEKDIDSKRMQSSVNLEWSRFATSIDFQNANLQLGINEAVARSIAAENERRYTQQRAEIQAQQNGMDKLRLSIQTGHLDIAAQQLNMQKEAALLDQKRYNLQERAEERAAEAMKLSRDQFQLQIKSDERAQMMYSVEIEKARQELQIASARVITVYLENAAREYGLQDAERSLKGKQQLDDALAKVSTFYKLPLINYEMFLATTDAKLKDLYSRGMVDPAVQSNLYGGAPDSTILGSMDKHRTLPLPLEPAARQTFQVLQNMDTAYLNSKTSDPMYKNGTKDEQNAMRNTHLMRQFGTQLSNVPETGSVYSLPSLNVILTTPAFRDYIMRPDIEALSKSDPNAPARVQDVIAIAMKKVADGATPGQVAKELADIYSAAVKTNSAVKEFDRFLIPRPTLGVNGFNTAVPGTNPMNPSPVILDLTNAAKVEHYLQMRTNRQRAFDALPNVGVQQPFGIFNADPNR